MREIAPRNSQFVLPGSHSYAPKPHPHYLAYQKLSTPCRQANDPATGQAEIHARFPISCLRRLVMITFSRDVGAPPLAFKTEGLEKTDDSHLLRERTGLPSVRFLGLRDNLWSRYTPGR